MPHKPITISHLHKSLSRCTKVSEGPGNCRALLVVHAALSDMDRLGHVLGAADSDLESRPMRGGQSEKKCWGVDFEEESWTNHH